MAQLVVRQFDICRNPDRASRKSVPFLVVLQSDLIDDLNTVIVAPLEVLAPSDVLTRLNPAIVVEGKRFCVSVQHMSGVQRNRLGPVVANVSDRRDAFIRAIDLLFTGV